MIHPGAFARLVLLLSLAPVGAGASPPRAAGALVKALAPTGRAEAALRYAVPSASGGVRAVHATLALEPPASARIDVSASGEKLVARADGGEWLQPATRQLVRFPARQAAPALRWWRVLLSPDASARERRVGEGRYVITLLSPMGAPEDSAEVWLDPKGLPARLVVPAGDPEAAVYRLSGWRFVRARGPAGFRLVAPRGFETVDLP